MTQSLIGLSLSVWSSLLVSIAASLPCCLSISAFLIHGCQPHTLSVFVLPLFKPAREIGKTWELWIATCTSAHNPPLVINIDMRVKATLEISFFFSLLGVPNFQVPLYNVYMDTLTQGIFVFLYTCQIHDPG